MGITAAGFLVLLGAGIYLEKLTWMQVLQWFLTAGSLCAISYKATGYSWIAPAVILLVCDAALVLVVFEQDINVPRSRGGF